jgi:hypothetical protein
VSKPRNIWLHTNRRAFWLGLIILSPFLAASISCLLFSSNALWRWAAVGATVVLAYLLLLCMYLMFRPRLSYRNEHLQVCLRSGAPIQVPIEVVECFFRGQGETLLPRPFAKRDSVDETSTVVVRLAEAAKEWEHIDVNPALGLWCDSYITVRGTWCEPITNELLKRLNENLIAAHRLQREGAASNTSTHDTTDSPTGS